MMYNRHLSWIKIFSTLRQIIVFEVQFLYVSVTGLHGHRQSDGLITGAQE